MQASHVPCIIHIMQASHVPCTIHIMQASHVPCIIPALSPRTPLRQESNLLRSCKVANEASGHVSESLSVPSSSPLERDKAIERERARESETVCGVYIPATPFCGKSGGNCWPMGTCVFACTCVRARGCKARGNGTALASAVLQEYMTKGAARGS